MVPRYGGGGAGERPWALQLTWWQTGAVQGCACATAPSRVVVLSLSVYESHLEASLTHG